MNTRSPQRQSAPSTDGRVLHCAWLVHPEGRIQRDQRITVENGLVCDVGDVPPDERTQIQPIAVLPPFVNVHTHLEFSGLEQPLPPPSPFPDWIRSVIRYRSALTESDTALAAGFHSGLDELRQQNTILVGEITTSEIGRSCLESDPAAASMTIISFRELIGFSSERRKDLLQLCQRHLERDGIASPSSIVRGISPHAPYSVHPDVVAESVVLAARASAPVAMHLAETSAEIQLLQHRSGPFRDFLDQLGLWEASSLRGVSRILDYLHMLAQAPHSLAVHGNWFDDEDIRFLASRPGMTTVYCPRTHAWFGHPEHPWRRLQAAGARVVLGTDSRASNPDLSIWKELQFVARLPDSPPITRLLRMVTTDACEALGQSPEICELRPGLPFRATIVQCNASTEFQLIHELLSAAAQSWESWRALQQAADS
ncbi:MAG: amidohydrolase family protein [Planctomycetaceae bacterium]